MIKLVALYRRPSDTADFDTHFTTTHVPLIRQFPGLRRIEVTKITGAPLGEARYYAMTEMYFENREAMDAALASKEGKSVVRDLMAFAADLVVVFHGEVLE